MYTRLVIITITKNPGAKRRGVISHWRGLLCDNDRLTVHYTLHNCPNSGKNSINIIVLFYIPLAQTVEDNAGKTGLMSSQHDGQKKMCLQKIEEKKKIIKKKTMKRIWVLEGSVMHTYHFKVQNCVFSLCIDVNHVSITF